VGFYLLPTRHTMRVAMEDAGPGVIVPTAVVSIKDAVLPSLESFSSSHLMQPQPCGQEDAPEGEQDDQGEGRMKMGGAAHCSLDDVVGISERGKIR
jgi:hypothetical protein